MKYQFGNFVLALCLNAAATAFVVQPTSQVKRGLSSRTIAGSSCHALRQTSTPVNVENEELALQKKKLLGLLRTEPFEDPVLADPITKQGILISTKSAILGGDPSGSTAVKYRIQSADKIYSGSSDSYINLLEPVPEKEENADGATSRQKLRESIARNFAPYIPPPLRSAYMSYASGAGSDSEYIPMRDLFTSPAVSYAYERGWRQGFERAGYPGPDKEAQLAMDYFAPSMVKPNATGVLVDMSCATGLFTRRFAASGKYKRVLGCDYSSSMLEEARRRIRADPALSRSSSTTRLDLVRLDVGQIPMKDNSVDALHAGAAMHCWPDLPAAVSEIYRVLKPGGGRYFATTFLSSWFSVLRATGGNDAEAVNQKSFHYFESVNELRSLMELGGFSPDKISIEVLGNACVVIRCEK